MDARSRKALLPIYKNLRPGYEGEDIYGDFINFRDADDRCARVIRFVGKGRMMVLFRYPTGPFYRHGPAKDQETLYLHEDGTLKPFDANLIVAQHKAEKNLGPYGGYSWDKVIGEWLENNGARQYTGRNWVGQIAGDLVTVLTAWEREHSGMEFPH